MFDFHSPPQRLFQQHLFHGSRGTRITRRFLNPWAGLAGCACLLLILCACSGNNSRGGGYYQKDGPGDIRRLEGRRIEDAVPRVEPLMSGPNRPYSVMGRTYIPDTRERAFAQKGRASWYGKQFHGQPTSSGEKYDMYTMTAAHPTLPIPSYARITRVSTGTQVIVRVNDRGPFISGRIIDLSYAAAYKLGYLNDGSAEVLVERILPAEIRAGTWQKGASPAATAQTLPVFPAPAPAIPPIAALPAPTSAGIYMQLGAFRTREGALALADHLRDEFSWLQSALKMDATEGWYRLQTGPYATRSDAERDAARIQHLLGTRPVFVQRR